MIGRSFWISRSGRPIGIQLLHAVLTRWPQLEGFPIDTSSSWKMLWCWTKVAPLSNGRRRQRRICNQSSSSDKTGTCLLLSFFIFVGGVSSGQSFQILRRAGRFWNPIQFQAQLKTARAGGWQDGPVRFRGWKSEQSGCRAASRIKETEKWRHQRCASPLDINKVLDGDGITLNVCSVKWDQSRVCGKKKSVREIGSPQFVETLAEVLWRYKRAACTKQIGFWTMEKF